MPKIQLETVYIVHVVGSVVDASKWAVQHELISADGEAAGAGVGADSIRVAITSDTPLDTTRAFLKQLIIAGAPWARSFAVAAASRRATPYNACPASGHAVQLLKVENLWQSFDCVRLTLCSTETRHYYEW